MDLLTSSGQIFPFWRLCALCSLYLTGHGVGGLAHSKLWENCVGGSGGGEWLQFHCLFTEMEQIDTQSWRIVEHVRLFRKNLVSIGFIETFCDTLEVFWQIYPSAKVWPGHHSRVWSRVPAACPGNQSRRPWRWPGGETATPSSPALETWWWWSEPLTTSWSPSTWALSWLVHYEMPIPIWND